MKPHLAALLALLILAGFCTLSAAAWRLSARTTWAGLGLLALAILFDHLFFRGLT